MEPVRQFGPPTVDLIERMPYPVVNTLLDDGFPRDGVLIEWVNQGTLRGAAIELRGVDRFTLRNGKVSEGVSYFDPRPFLKEAAT